MCYHVEEIVIPISLGVGSLPRGGDLHQVIFSQPGGLLDRCVSVRGQQEGLAASPRSARLAEEDRERTDDGDQQLHDDSGQEC